MWRGMDPFRASADALVGQHLGLRATEHRPSQGLQASGWVGTEEEVRAHLAMPHQRLDTLYLLSGRVEAVVDGRGGREPVGAVPLDPVMPDDRRRPGAFDEWFRAMQAPGRWVGELVALRHPERLTLARAGWRGTRAPEAWSGRTVVLRLAGCKPLHQPAGEDPWHHEPMPFWMLYDGTKGQQRHLVFDRLDAAEHHALRMPSGRYGVAVWRVEGRVRGSRGSLTVEEGRAWNHARARRRGSFMAIVRRGHHTQVVGAEHEPWDTREPAVAWAEQLDVDALIAAWEMTVDKF